MKTQRDAGSMRCPAVTDTVIAGVPDGVTDGRRMCRCRLCCR